MNSESTLVNRVVAEYRVLQMYLSDKSYDQLSDEVNSDGWMDSIEHDLVSGFGYTKEDFRILWDWTSKMVDNVA